VNHDALFKMLLKNPAVLKAFFEQFLPEASAFVDFQHLEFVDKERITLGGKKRTGDLVVKTRFRGKETGFLIHLEHQAQPDTNLGRRMLEYFVLDWQAFDLPVYPIAVLSHARPGNIQATPLAVDFPNKRVLDFNFDVIDLARLDARAFVKLHNPAALALAARMKFDQNEKVRLTRDFFASLGMTPTGREEKELVAEFFCRYQPLDSREALKLQEEMSMISPDLVRQKIMQWTNPFIEIGRREGIAKGRHEEAAEIVLRQLARRLGLLTATQKDRIKKLELAQIEELGESLLDFKTRADLVDWLKKAKYTIP